MWVGGRISTVYCQNYDRQIPEMWRAETTLSLVSRSDNVTVQAGAGIVADSDPAAEYTETVNKAKALLRAIEAAETNG